VSSSVEAENHFSVASQHRWERRVLHSATQAVFTTPSALQDYAERYPGAGRSRRLSVIGNGYDEAAFVDLPSAPPPQNGRPLMLVHSGLLYPEGRDPSPFFNALARLKAAGFAVATQLRVVLRASGWEARYQQEIDRLGIADIVTLAAPVGNREALVEQAAADGLLLFQGSKFDRQIPAKVYEYLRIGRPIFALVGPAGDTASVLRDTGGAMVALPESIDTIEARLVAFVNALRDGRAPVAGSAAVSGYSRKEGARSLARLLEKAHG
jgi:hypothetical protein